MRTAGELRRWIGIVALACLAAGVAVGWSLPRVHAAMFPDAGSDPWLERFRTDYGLRAEQVRLIRTVLHDRRMKLIDVYTRSATTPEQDEEIRAIRRQADDRIKALADDAPDSAARLASISASMCRLESPKAPSW